mmetsp:Transcript_136575/g.255088  ORF Transcript_136575/g.255088 Transcript_136575/m.255088 type:complete len:274 (-) Transcript_136575:38-859(-)
MIPFLAAAVMFSTVHCEDVEDSDDPELDDPDFEEDTSRPKLTTEQIDKLFALVDAGKKGKVSVKDLMVFSAATRESLANQSSPQIAEHMDTDKDGKLSLSEVLKDLNEMPQDENVRKRKDLETATFREADVNKDGLLDKDEFPAIFYSDIKQSILKINTQYIIDDKDANGDGRLTITEFWKGVEEAEEPPTEIEEGDFRKVDRDQDGFVDLAEMMIWESGIVHVEDAMQEIVLAADTDNDTHVSREELSKAHDAVRQTDGFFHFADWVKHHEL